MTANSLAEVRQDVAVEPELQLLTGETLQYHSAITTDEARLDVCVLGFWGVRSARAYFDVKVFNSYVKSYWKRSLPAMYSNLEQLKSVLTSNASVRLNTDPLLLPFSQQLVAWERQLKSHINDLPQYCLPSGTSLTAQ